ncbi:MULTISPECIES: hypothetical protein [unclassified Psychrobacter]|uniref:hypothetical protein n=1 Tax=unclassified Psychrobacter TaxID=196806 RepID=UPI00071633DF|nr:hypothetical protein [Psychrobacter sp. P11F6]KRG33895.1 hypothetical protein AK822_02810 [Psychrobacter sp. P11F6]
MTDKNINLCDTEDEKLRYNISMFPSLLLLKKGMPEGKGLMRKLTKGLSKIPRKQKIQIADIFDNIATTQEKGSIKPEDIKLEEGGLSSHPYESLVRTFGAEKSTHLLEHARIVDDCLSQKFNSKLITNFKTYLFKTFNYEDEVLNINMPVGDFYSFIVLSFIANLDVVVHANFYSKDIMPISLGWLFMHKRDPDKWEYDTVTKKYKLTNKNGNPFTCTSRSFIHFILTDLCFSGSHKNLKPKKMPKSIYRLRGKINWKTNDEEGQLYSFLDRKSERDSKRNWISLEEFYWLLGMEDSPEDEPDKVLVNFQKSFIKYIKSANINELGGLPPTAEGMTWFIYAFFQSIYEHTDKLNKQTKEQHCFICDEYYGLWESMTAKYEKMVSAHVNNPRVEWPDYLKKQATRIEHVA